jgi:hypothetical protein
MALTTPEYVRAYPKGVLPFIPFSDHHSRTIYTDRCTSWIRHLPIYIPWSRCLPVVNPRSARLPHCNSGDSHSCCFHQFGNL